MLQIHCQIYLLLLLQGVFLNFVTGDSANSFRSIALLKIQSKLIEYSNEFGIHNYKNLLLRGGEKKEKTGKSHEEDDSADENVSEESEEEDNDDDDDLDIDQVEARRPVPLVSSITELWSKTPPITQVYLLSSAAFTTLAFVLNSNKWPEILLFDWKSIIFGLQFWRCYTGFLFFGPLDPFYPLTMQFVWQHMSQLEKLNYNKPEEFLLMLLIGAATLITVYTTLGISMKFLGHNLATYLVYIWSRVFEGVDVNFMDLINLKAEMIPWFFCVQTYLLEREIPFADLIGIVVGHIYHYLKEKKRLRAPEFLRKLFNSEEMRKKYARFKDDFE
mmetsp:Transcript_673/g.1156  ORF Transcript_673/g.1156 Transcript_673/m.1156 type:complete len:331 (+) Transcript_673:1633-2625(+)